MAGSVTPPSRTPPSASGVSGLAYQLRRTSRNSRSTLSPGIVRGGRLLQCRCRFRRHAVTRGLLIGIGELEQDRLAIGTAEEGNADRQIVRRETRGQSDRGRI